ncbi:acyltransferase family protein [Lactococcus hircilactis]|uniref:Acyltransferase family protein n=1 Tax=Lactococcus hircilactis TaxID=1494462 RepID=A0A7X1ZC72_9LACT|nr:acyltransferase family protein [Lactococcus hircilactis]MQW40410.1 acyltransferase family protein [Lactococcus hircilactis]
MKRYITGFNGLRTLGVLVVILYHIYPSTIRGGFLGVVLFFVLSGYLVTDSLLRTYKKNGKINVLKFWGNRLKRIYPSLLTVFFVVTPYLLIFQRNLLSGLRSEFFSSIFSVQNWWQIQQGNSYFTNITGASPFKHIYYLSIEGQFFILWPLLLIVLLRFVKSKGKIFLITSIITLISVVLMAILFVPGADPTRVYYGTDTRLFSLMMGSSLAFIWPLDKHFRKVNKKGQQVGLIATLITVFILVLSYLFMPAESAVTYYGGMWLISFVSMILIALVAHPALRANRIFSNVVFDYIGTRSLGIYLWQLPVFTMAEEKLVNPTAWYNVLWQLLLIVGLSELSYRFIEKPAQKFDYSNTMNILHTFITGGNWKTRKKILQTSGLIVLIAILAVIVFSPASARDQEILQKKILAQQAILMKEQTQKANDKVSLPLKTIASKYHVEPLVAEKMSKLKALALGDSVMVAASTNLKEMFPQMTINAVVGEQANVGAQKLETQKEAIKKSDVLLIGLGTNGLLDFGGTNYVDKIMSMSQGKPVYWINVQAPNKPWVSVNNTLLKASAKKYSNLTIIDWNDASKNNPSWFYSDRIHPQNEGAIAYTTLVAKAMAK